MYGLKTYGINWKEALIGDWEELNEETYVCNACYKTTSRFTSCLYFYLPEYVRLAKNRPISFSRNSESLETLSQSKRGIELH